MTCYLAILRCYQMTRFTFHPLLLPLLAPLLQLLVRAEETYVAHSCSVRRFTSNTTYETNLHALLSSLTSQNDVSSGFHRVSEGEKGQGALTGYALCRGDVSQSACSSCVNFSATHLPHLCPTHLEAAVWYDNCLLKYSPSSISAYTPPKFFYYATTYHALDPLIDVSDLTAYFYARVELLSTLAEKASLGNLTRKFATGDINFTASGTIYALLQCVPDLTQEQCAECLNLVAENLPRRGQRWRALASACDLRVAPVPFSGPSGNSPGTYSPRSLSPSPPEPRNDISSGNKNRNILLIIVLTICGVTLIASICFLLSLLLRRKKITSESGQRTAAAPPHGGLRAIRVETDDQRPARGGPGAAAPPSNVRPIMEIPMPAAQSPVMSSNTQDGNSYTWILKTPINPPCPR